MNQKLSIPWFNPRQMDDETVLSLSTAQDELLALFEQGVETRLKNKVATKHWLITGTRGAGKSFFYAQCKLATTNGKRLMLPIF